MENFPYKLKLARKASGLSQAALAERVGISKQALSKYERGLTGVDSQRLISFATALGQELDYFFTRPRLNLEEVSFRKRSKLTGTRLHKVGVEVSKAVDNLLELEEILDVSRSPVAPLLEGQPVTLDGDAVDRAAADLRERWGLGLAPILDVTGLLERKGIRVVEVDIDEDFDGLSAWVDGTVPVIVINVTANLDTIRRRYTLLHELAHLLLAIPEELPDRDVERICQRFPALVLLPAQVLKEELGGGRWNISLLELKAIRATYGISAASVVYQAGAYGLYDQLLVSKFWRKRAKDEALRLERGFPDMPTEALPPRYFDRLLARALAEEAVSVTRAASLANISIQKAQQLGAGMKGLAPKKHA